MCICFAYELVHRRCSLRSDLVDRLVLLMKVIITTLVAAVVWFGAWLLISSPYVSFRHGWFAAPND